MTDSPPAIDVSIDETSLSGDNGAIYVFQWLGSNEKALRQASAEDIKENQGPLTESLIKIISTPDSYPTPGRPIRELVALCLVHIYTLGETKTLYDTVHTLLKSISEVKNTLKDVHRVAGIYCIGELMRNFGSQVMSLVVETVTACLKLSKSSHPTIIRYHCFLTLENTVLSAKRAITDSLMKDITKQARSALSDKAFPVVRAASSLLTLLFPFPDSSKPLVDVEQIVSLCVKQLEVADQPTRGVLSKLVAHVLASTQVERVVQVAEPPKQTKKNAGLNQGEDDEGGPGTHTVVQEVKKLMSPHDMLTQLSVHFNKPAASRRMRVGISDCYVALLTQLSSTFAETNYALIVTHFMNDIVSNSRNNGTRYEVLFVRHLVSTLLRDLIGVRMLGEQAQISAIQELSNSYLKRWPALMPGQAAPNPLVLTVALREVAGLLRQLGNAPVPVQDALLNPLTTLLSHPVHTVRLSTAWTLRCFCYSTPLRLPKVLLNLVELLQHDLTALSTPAAPSDIYLRVLGHAYGLSGLLSVIPQRPLYVSYDITANVFHVAVQLLKRAGEHDVKVAKIEIEVAWTMLASLMTLGPNFVRAHLPQLLLLWRNALPKPTTKDGLSGRSPGEWLFLLSVRENALRAVYSFLVHNSAVLVTADVARRIASLVTNALQFAGTFATQRVEDVVDQPPSAEGRGLSLVGVDALFRTRIFQCFSALGVTRTAEATQMSLLQSTITLFASPEGYSGSSVQAAIAASSGAYTSIWQSTDGYAYGLTSIELVDDSSGNVVEGTGDWLNRDTIDAAIDDVILKPILCSWEHDPFVLSQAGLSEGGQDEPDSPPALTASVNASIHLFAELLPLQDVGSVTRTVTQLLDATNPSKFEKNTGRKAAVLINTTIALVLAFRRAQKAGDTLGNPQVTNALSDFLKTVLIDGDVVLRKAASEAMGRLANLAGTSFLTSLTKTLVNEVVSNRDPYGRAGCALAFGSIHGHVGGLAAGPLLKTTVHVLMSLINDPHPVVHFWALRALARTIDAASLAYASHVPSTLGLLFKVYMLESHEPEGGVLNYVNMSGELPFYQALCQTIDAIITVVGPDIQESVKTRSLVLDLVHQFVRDNDVGVRVEAIRCIQHLLIFAPEHIDVPKLVAQFREYLMSSRRPLKMTSINALYQLVQRDVMSISRLGGDQLVEELFAMLDDDSSVDGVRNVITSWLQQTVIYNPSAWIDLCQRIMSRTTASQQAGDAAAKRGEVDDEGQSLSVEPTDETNARGTSRSTARWRTQLFALQCLHEICKTVGRSGRREHLEIAFARSQGLPLPRLLVSRISDLIRIAFTASAAHVMEIRLEGLTVLRDVIEIFAESPDPDFEGALLLEQYQAPITAALTPAFSSDSTPEILAAAIKACAVFVGSGVVKNVQRMGRMLKLLTSALEQCQKSGLLQLGDAEELGPNASVMCRIATLSAWAELETATETQPYLVKVIEPYRKALASLWIGALRDYASIRADTELLDDSTTGGVDSSYSSLGREVLLPYYRDSWSAILQAVTSSMEVGDPSIRIALDGGDPLTTEAAPQTGNNHTASFFFVVFGLVFEALSTSSPDAGAQSTHTSVIALKALKFLVQNQYAGDAFRDVVVFEELVNLFYRMALTEPVVVQVHLAETLASLATSIAKASSNGHMADSSSPPQVHCLRICAYILKRVNNSPRENALHDTSPADKIKLINTSFDAFVTIAAACDPTRTLEYRIVAITLYNDLLTDELSEADYVGPTLQSLKKLLQDPPSTVAGKSRYEKVVHAILSACVLNIDAMRGREGPACVKKIKSNLLAIVLILTLVPPTIRLGSALIEHCAHLISQRLVEPGEMSVIAAHCAKTLIVTSTAGNPVLQRATKLLLPGAIECVAKIAVMEDENFYERRSQIIGEIWKAFAALFTSATEELRPRLLAVLLPTMAMVLEPTITPPPGLHTQTVREVLTFATASPLAFKEATNKLNAETREILEASVRQVLGGGKPTASDVHKPQILLRSF